MKSLRVTATTQIAAPVEIVRRQFADVAHHAVTGLHRGVSFAVIDDNGLTCRYRQTSRVGPLRLRQDMRLERTVTGPLVNTVTAGQFTGGTITFDVTGPTEQVAGRDATSERAMVTATLAADIGGVTQFAAPVLRRTVRRALVRGLDEDRADLESGRYHDAQTPALR